MRGAAYDPRRVVGGIASLGEAHLLAQDAEGRERGVVQEAYEGGSGILLNVKGPHGMYEVPFAAAICTKIDLKKKRIYLAPVMLHCC